MQLTADAKEMRFKDRSKKHLTTSGLSGMSENEEPPYSEDIAARESRESRMKRGVVELALVRIEIAPATRN